MSFLTLSDIPKEHAFSDLCSSPGLGIILDLPRQILAQKGARKETSRLLQKEQAAAVQDAELAEKEDQRQAELDVVRQQLFERKIKSLSKVLLPVSAVVGTFLIVRELAR